MNAIWGFSSPPLFPPPPPPPRPKDARFLNLRGIIWLWYSPYSQLRGRGLNICSFQTCFLTQAARTRSLASWDTQVCVSFQIVSVSPKKRSFLVTWPCKSNLAPLKAPCICSDLKLWEKFLSFPLKKKFLDDLAPTEEGASLLRI